MFEQNQSILAALQHCLSLFQRARMIEHRRECASVPVEYFLNEKEVFLLASHQQDVQQGGPGLCRG